MESVQKLTYFKYGTKMETSSLTNIGDMRKNKPLGTTFGHIFLFLDVRIPANALCRPIRTKFLYYITSSHAPVIAFVSQNILKIK